MPDEAQTGSFDHVAQSEILYYQNSTPSSAVISPLRTGGSRPSISSDAADRSSSYDTDTTFAYRANSFSEATLDRSAYDLNGPQRTIDAHPAAGSRYELANSSTNAENLPQRIAGFGSQPWPTTVAPYTDITPQSTYEPSGELFHEAVNNLEQFDNSSTFDGDQWISEEGTRASATDTVHTNPTTESPNIARARPSFVRPALKRNHDSTGAADANTKDNQVQLESRKVRRVSFEQMPSTGPVPTNDEESSLSDSSATTRSAVQLRSQGNLRPDPGSQGTTAHAQPPTVQRDGAARNAKNRGSTTPSAHPPSILPPEKVFPIQIGSEVFRLSGASISSDAPSYFTQFFEEQIKQNEESGGVRTLYIDRDPGTFREVARHLQGYYVRPTDGSSFVKLFADAQFYSLPRLINQLFEAEIYIQIGDRHFQIPKDLFSDPGNSPNFFSLGFAVFFSSPGEVFPGIDRRGLLRPPSITPPYVPGRSPETFAQLLHLLKGYPLHIENEDHRTELLRDCRYFHFRGLEQKIVAHEISYNLERQREEICLRIEDIKPSGVSYKAEGTEDDHDVAGGWVRYARPFVDDKSYELIVEIGGECTTVDLDDMRADFHGLAKARVSSLFQVVANKMNLPTNAPLGAMMLSGLERSSHTSPGNTPLSEDRVKVRFEPASDITLDGSPYDIDWSSPLGQRMGAGTDKARDVEDDLNMMEEDHSSRRQSSSQPRARPGRQAQSGGNSHATSAKRPEGRRDVPLSRTASATSTSRKRPRVTESLIVAEEHREWIIRSGQWRLRIQHNDQESTRKGYEIVFTAVKVDAYSQERFRNAQRRFLGGS